MEDPDGPYEGCTLAQAGHDDRRRTRRVRRAGKACGGSVYVEPGFSSETVAALRAKGHSVTITTGMYGGYQAIRRDDQKGVYFGASESRKDGHAAGF